MKCISGVSRETELIGHKSMVRQMLERIGSHGHGGWEAPRAAVSKVYSQARWWYSSSPSPQGWEPESLIAVRLRPRKSGCFRLSLKVGKIISVSAQGSQAEDILSFLAFMFYAGLQLIQWGQLTLGKALLNLLIQVIISSNTFSETHSE